MARVHHMWCGRHRANDGVRLRVALAFASGLPSPHNPISFGMHLHRLPQHKCATIFCLILSSSFFIYLKAVYGPSNVIIPSFIFSKTHHHLSRAVTMSTVPQCVLKRVHLWYAPAAPSLNTAVHESTSLFLFLFYPSFAVYLTSPSSSLSCGKPHHIWYERTAVGFPALTGFSASRYLALLSQYECRHFWA